MTSTDPRYTTDALESMTQAELSVHLAERSAQLDRADRMRREYHDAYSLLDDDDTPKARELMANISMLSGEAATQRRLVRRLEAQLAKRNTAASKLEEKAHALDIPIAAADYIVDQLSENGLPGFDRNDDETGETIGQMWLHANLSHQAHTDETPTNKQVADRVIAAWQTLYEDPETVTVYLSGHDAQRIHDLLTTLNDIDQGEHVEPSEIENYCRQLRTAAGRDL